MKRFLFGLILSVLILPSFFSPKAYTTISSSTFYDFIQNANQAIWQSGSGILPFPGSSSDSRGFAIMLSNASLEDNKTYPKVLETHPEWKDKTGYITGTYPEITIPQSAKLELKLGFLNGATGTDGVKYRVYFDMGQPVLIFERNKAYTGIVDTATVDLSNYQSKKGKFILYVSVLATSNKDWACWIDSKITIPGNPDLVITDIWVDSSRYVHYKIKNIGDATASYLAAALTNTLYLDGVKKTTDSLTKIFNPGEEYESYFKNYTYPLPKTSEILRVCADSENIIKESNEQNNCKEKTETPSFGGIQVNTGCPQAKVDILNEKRQTIKSGISDANNNYSTGLVLMPGTYIVVVSKENCSFQPSERTVSVPANQIASISFNCSCAKGPDLVITEAGCDYLKKLIYYTIKNSGDEKVDKAFSVSLYFSGILKGEQKITSAINPDGTHSSYFEGYVTKCADLEIKIVVDSKDDIKEYIENNNSKEVKCECEEKPDLIISNVTISERKACFTVKNIGPKDISGSVFTVGLKVDGKAIEETKINFTNSNDNKLDKCFNYLLPFGKHTLQICADTQNVIKESNENNNCLEKPFEIQEFFPDLVVESIKCYGENLLYFSVKNIGYDFSTTSWACNAEVYFDGEKKGKINLKSPSSVISQGISKSNGISIYETSFAIESPVLVKVIIDPERTIRESNEGNNEKEQELEPCVIKPIDLIISGIIVDGNSVYYKIKNVGEGRAGYRRTSASAVIDKLTPSSALYVDGTKVSHDTLVLPLEAGQEVQSYFKFDFVPSPPFCTLTVCADWENKFTETDENNNCFEKIVPVEEKLPENPCGCFENKKFEVRITPYDGFAVGNVIGGFEAEIITAVDEDAPGDNGKFYIYNAVGQIITSFDARFTKNDRITIGDFWGDEDHDEIAVAVDEDDKVYIYDSAGSLLKDFNARFTKYDTFEAGNVMGDNKDEIIISIDDDDLTYVYTSQGENIINFSIPWDFEGSCNLGDKSDHNDAMAIGNVLADKYEEILLLDRNGDKSLVYIYAVVNNTLFLKTKLMVRFTKYDLFTTGDLLGNEREEIIIGIDEDHIIYIYDAVSGLLKLRYAEVTPVDLIAAGNIFGSSKDELIIAQDDDHLIFLISEEP